MIILLSYFLTTQSGRLGICCILTLTSEPTYKLQIVFLFIILCNTGHIYLCKYSQSDSGFIIILRLPKANLRSKQDYNNAKLCLILSK